MPLILQEVRNKQYHNYFNLEEEVAAAQPAIDAAAVKARAGARCFDFYRSWRQARSSIVHFQLRNLLWATSGEHSHSSAGGTLLCAVGSRASGAGEQLPTCRLCGPVQPLPLNPSAPLLLLLLPSPMSPPHPMIPPRYRTAAHDLYLVHENKVQHWNNMTQRLDSPMDVSGGVTGAVAPGVGQVQLCTLCARWGTAGRVLAAPHSFCARECCVRVESSERVRCSGRAGLGGWQQQLVAFLLPALADARDHLLHCFLQGGTGGGRWLQRGVSGMAHWLGRQVCMQVGSSATCCFASLLGPEAAEGTSRPLMQGSWGTVCVHAHAPKVHTSHHAVLPATPAAACG